MSADWQNYWFHFIEIAVSPGLDADSFWFSFLHSLKHVLQKKVKTVFVSLDASEMHSQNAALEEEADNFAMNVLVPPSKLKAFAPDRDTSDEEICSFAREIGIHPCIVAGRLQHDRILAPSRCSALK